MKNCVLTKMQRNFSITVLIVHVSTLHIFSHCPLALLEVLLGGSCYKTKFSFCYCWGWDEILTVACL